ncbi:hypothetical protein C2845_PM17G12660 [Panicum miliaceum]|uniref:KIB1-4 beta-propeller domain-containing protein n=1 Tax=Panicum miliaceum TaxID=4540 RepID=A0A3L6Q1Y0_PANMI|nr:hypothetical protein C2845_PM17G12660 [Panicum miliaceum]
MNPFSQDVVRLPPPSAPVRSGDAYSRSLPVINGSGVVNCAVNTAQCVMSFGKVVLSSSPDSGSKCVVVAMSVIKNEAKLALWRSGMSEFWQQDVRVFEADLSTNPVRLIEMRAWMVTASASAHAAASRFVPVTMMELKMVPWHRLQQTYQNTNFGHQMAD